MDNNLGILIGAIISALVAVVLAVSQYNTARKEKADAAASELKSDSFQQKLMEKQVAYEKALEDINRLQKEKIESDSAFQAMVTGDGNFPKLMLGFRSRKDDTNSHVPYGEVQVDIANDFDKPLTNVFVTITDALGFMAASDVRIERSDGIYSVSYGGGLEALKNFKEVTQKQLGAIGPHCRSQVYGTCVLLGGSDIVKGFNVTVNWGFSSISYFIEANCNEDNFKIVNVKVRNNNASVHDHLDRYYKVFQL